MKRKLFNTLGLVVAFALSGLFTGCSSDGDGGGSSFSDPAHLDSSAKFNITDRSTGIESIELTESGDYIVQNTGGYYSSYAIKDAQNERKSFFGKPISHKSRAQYGNISYGKYTKVDENTYNLIGYGTITVVKTGDSAVSLDIVRDNGTTITASATVSSTSSSSMTNKLCRTWSLDKIRVQLSITGMKKFDKTVKVNQQGLIELRKAQIDWLEDNGMDAGFDDDYLFEDLEEYPETVIFTRSGTYMVLYHGGELDVAMWRWYNESKGLLIYAWDESDWNDWDDDEEDMIKVKFSGSNLLFNESYTEDFGYVDGYGRMKISSSVDYFMSEVR